MVFQVTNEFSAPYDHPQHTATQRNAGLRNALASVVDTARRRIEGEQSTRVSSVSTSPLSIDFLPEGEVCGGFRWTQTDEQVPGQLGRVYLTRGYQVICLGSQPQSDSTEVIRVLFSERYCEELGHQPQPDLDDTARGSGGFGSTGT